MSDAAEEFKALYPLKPKDAAEQAIQFAGFIAGVPIDLGDEVWEVPNPSLLDDEQQERYDMFLVQWQEDREKFDRHPDTKDAKGEPVKGELKEPFRIGGVPVENYNTRLAKALLGAKYDKFIKAGGRSSQIQFHWHQMNEQLLNREKADSKSAVGGGPVEPVSDGAGIGSVEVSPPLDQ